MANISGFETLDVWRESRRLKLKIYKLIKDWPLEEKFDLTSQTRRAARSIPANISEGHGRFYFKENIAFCRKSRGSLSELLNHLIDAVDSGYISDEQLIEFRNDIEKIGKMINGYIRYLKNQSNNQNDT